MKRPSLDTWLGIFVGIFVVVVGLTVYSHARYTHAEGRFQHAIAAPLTFTNGKLLFNDYRPDKRQADKWSKLTLSGSAVAVAIGAGLIVLVVIRRGKRIGVINKEVMTD